MDKEIGLVLLALFLSLLIVIFFYSYQKNSEQFFLFCASKEWTGVHSIRGDFSGEINCGELWDRTMSNKQWTKICSHNVFSVRPSCYTLCNLDCEFYNKLNKENRCVC